MNKNKVFDNYTFLNFINNNKRSKNEIMKRFNIPNDDAFFEIIYIYHNNLNYIYLYKNNSYVSYSTDDIDYVVLNTNGKKRLYELKKSRRHTILGYIITISTLVIAIITLAKG